MTTLRYLALLPFLVACAASPKLVSEPTPPALQPVQARITDSVIRADLAYIRSLRQRLQTLNEKGRPIDDYWHCKAQAWVDMGYEEYTDNDRTGVVEAALAQGLDLIKRMEAGEDPITTDTPVIEESLYVRPDLWTFAKDKKAQGVHQSCGACKLAKMEVQTVWIGHQYDQLGWRLAERNVLAAERLRREMLRDIEECPTNRPKAVELPAPIAPIAPVCPVVPAAIMPACPPPPPPVQILVPAPSLVKLPTEVHFAFDRYDISAKTSMLLARVAAAMDQNPQARLQVLGITDLRGSDQYNVDLGRKRAQAVRAHLSRMGVDASRIDIETKGESTDDRVDQLIPRARNRRVDLILMGVEGLIPDNNDFDLQPDR